MEDNHKYWFGGGGVRKYLRVSLSHYAIHKRVQETVTKTAHLSRRRGYFDTTPLKGGRCYCACSTGICTDHHRTYQLTKPEFWSLDKWGKWGKMGGNEGNWEGNGRKMGEKWEKNGLTYPVFTVPFLPFVQSPKSFPHSSLSKNQATALTSGKMGNFFTLQHSPPQRLLGMVEYPVPPGERPGRATRSVQRKMTERPPNGHWCTVGTRKRSRCHNTVSLGLLCANHSVPTQGWAGFHRGGKGSIQPSG